MSRNRHAWLSALLVWLVGAMTAAVAGEASLPRYRHVFVIIEENRTADQIIGNPLAPNINRLAHSYGYASNFYAERHPSQPNYVAILGGDTFGIQDDDAFYCKPGLRAAGCQLSLQQGYPDHTISARSLMDQLQEHGLTWKGYFEDLPQPGALVYAWPLPEQPLPGKPTRLYASKHNGFVAFRNVQQDPARADKLVGFDVLEGDLASGELPNYAQIIPNQCDDMHGLHGDNLPPDCTNDAGLVARADRVVGDVVDKITKSAAWRGTANSAIVITFDEGSRLAPGHPQGCCGASPADPGGGWVATVVITNHGPRHVVDRTAHNHYSLLRTTEAVFGIPEYLGHAADRQAGVQVMTRLFAPVISPAH